MLLVFPDCLEGRTHLMARAFGGSGDAPIRPHRKERSKSYWRFVLVGYSGIISKLLQHGAHQRISQRQHFRDAQRQISWVARRFSATTLQPAHGWGFWLAG